MVHAYSQPKCLNFVAYISQRAHTLHWIVGHPTGGLGILIDEGSPS